jgi:hypothetical protein
MKSTLLSIGGIYCFGFAIFHVLFWKIFRWRQNLHRLTPTNRAIMQILNLRLIYIFILFGVISLVFQDDLLNTSVGRFIVIAISLFWLGRAIEQIIFFGLRNSISAAFFIVFLVGGTIFALPMVN